MSNDREFEFEIVESGVKLGETSAKGWTMEINKVSYNGKPARWDIRSWNGDHSRMGKGVSLSEQEIKNLYTFLSQLN